MRRYLSLLKILRQASQAWVLSVYRLRQLRATTVHEKNVHQMCTKQKPYIFSLSNVDNNAHRVVYMSPHHSRYRMKSSHNSSLITVPYMQISTSMNSSSSHSQDDDRPRGAQKQKKTTKDTIQAWKDKSFDIKRIEIWKRPIVGSKKCHAFILIETETVDYILERLDTGIRFECLPTPEDKKKETYIATKKSGFDISIHCERIAGWIEKKTKSEYNVLCNNCIDFVAAFMKEFADNEDHGLYSLEVETQQLFVIHCAFFIALILTRV